MPKKVVSVIIPTYNEAQNVLHLVKEIFDSINHDLIDLEIIIVDDNSPDGTGQVAEELTKQYPLRVIHRSGKFGLGSAVIAGFKQSNREILGVMDADMSHDPVILNDLISSLDTHHVTIGSRFEQKSSVEKWVWWRKVLSNIGVTLARRIVRVRDPLSGYFFFRRSVISESTLTTVGYKILFEILAKGKYTAVKEIPFTFRMRKFSVSKLNHKEYFLFLSQIFRYGAYRLGQKLKRNKAAAILGIIFFSIALFASWSQSVWLDEGISKDIAEQGIGTIVDTTMQTDLHPPLYYLLLYVTSFVGKNIFLYRLWSVFFYILTAGIFYIYLLKKINDEKKFAFMSLVLLLSSPFMVFYASEIRSYMLTILVALLQFIFFSRALDTKEHKPRMVGYTLSSLIGIYLFYPFLFTLFLEFLYIILYKRERFKSFLFSWILLFLLYIPWLVLVIFQRLGEAPNHFLAIPWWQIPAIIFVGFSGGRVAITDVNHIHDYWPTILSSVAVAVNFIGLYFVYKYNHLRDLVGRLLFISFGVVAIGLIISAAKFSLFDPRYYTQIFPLFFLLLVLSSHALYRYRKSWWTVCTSFMLLANLVLLGLYLFNPWYEREPWNHVVPALEQELEVGDAIVFIGKHQPPPTYTPYQKKQVEMISTYTDTQTDSNDLGQVEQHLLSSMHDNNRIWYSQFLEWQKDPDKKIRAIIEKDFRYIKTIGFFKVQFDLYERK